MRGAQLAMPLTGNYRRGPWGNPAPDTDQNTRKEVLTVGETRRTAPRRETVDSEKLAIGTRHHRLLLGETICNEILPEKIRTKTDRNGKTSRSKRVQQLPIRGGPEDGPVAYPTQS